MSRPFITRIIQTASYRFVSTSQSITAQAIREAMRVLEVSTGQSRDPKTLKKAYMDLAKTHHPDRPGGSEERMKLITTAYELLRNLTDGDWRLLDSHHQYYQRAQYQASTEAQRRAHEAFWTSQPGRRPVGAANPFHGGSAQYDYTYSNQWHYNPFMSSTETIFGRQSPRPRHRSFYFTRSSSRYRRSPLRNIGMYIVTFAIIYSIFAFILTAFIRIYRELIGVNDSELHMHHPGAMNKDALLRFQEFHRERGDRLFNPGHKRRGTGLTSGPRHAEQYKEWEIKSWPPLELDGSQGHLIRPWSPPYGLIYYVPPGEAR